MFIFPVICEKHEHEISISEEIFKKRDDPDLEMTKHMKCAYFQIFQILTTSILLGPLGFLAPIDAFKSFLKIIPEARCAY